MMHARRCLYVVTLLNCLTSLLPAQDRRGPFTHAPRSVRTRDIDQQHIRLDLRLDWDKQQVDAQAMVSLSPFKPTKEVILDAAGMKVSRVTRDSKSLKYETKPQQLIVQLDREFMPGEMVSLVIDYVVVRPKHGLHFVVPDDSEKNQPRMAWTQSEPEFAHYWFPCIDSPADRLTSEIIATAPKDYFVLSNGTLESKRLNADGTQTWHWRQAKSHVPYLFSVVAGEFDAYEQRWNEVPVVSYVPKGQLNLAARSFEKTPAMMDFFSRKIGVKYPWPKYTQICVDEYGWGGMEHTSATTLNMHTLHDDRAHLDVSSDNLVAHELIHQWYGDLLTCKDWGEIWLNESFATYFATLWNEEDFGWDEATWSRYEEAMSYMREDKRYRRAIVNYQYDSPDKVFDGHAYPKGGRVLHMLRFVLGDEMFWNAIHHYTTRNMHRTVETADFRIAIEEVTGQGLNWFFDQWLYHGGHPDFEVSWKWDDVAHMVRVSVKQTQKVDSVTPVFRMPVEIEVANEADVKLHRVELSKAEETFHFQSDRRPTRVCFDPKDWLLKSLKFEKSKEELFDQLENDANLMCRLQAAEMLAKFNEDDDVLAALNKALESDRFWAVRQEAAKSLGKFKGDKARDALIAASRSDAKSFVRREAIKSLGSFKHATTNDALRAVISTDQSYYAISEALQALAKVDVSGCEADHLAALNIVSHRQEVLKAAIDGLVKVKSAQACEEISQLLEGDISPERRVVLIGGLARLKPADAEVIAKLYEQLDNDRTSVRRKAIDAIVEVGDPGAIERLLVKRDEQEIPGTIRSIDDAVEKLRDKNKGIETLQKQLESLRQQNRKLEDRLNKLESKE
ncbi:MAG: HEAT repeat domain-containing protein [Planctomycetaceae bacterium]|nr:HEAT repeat domain-containing protein [Planctomycetales bacterium]MCB9925829.1 HEAT repeat domain-containing protein [Planctomycetaceae bacterium]